MATLDASPTSPTFNCYSTLAEAVDYHSKRLQNTTFTAASTATQASALMWATIQLDTLRWRGVRSDGAQPLEFPRRGLSYYESSDVGGFDFENVDVFDPAVGYFTKVTITDTAVPQFLKNACAELALWLVDSDTTAPTGLEGIKRIKVDVIEVENLPSDRPIWFNDAVRNLCWRFLKNSSKYSAPVRRVG